MRAARIERSVNRQLKLLPFSPATVKQDVSQKLVFYLFENQARLPRGHGRAGVPARVPPEADRRPPVRHRRRDHQGPAGRRALSRSGPGRPDRPVGHRGPVRPLPARQERREQGAGRRARQPAQPAAGGAPRAGPPAPAVGGPRRPARGPAGAGRRQGRLRRHEREQRRGAGAGQLAVVRPEHLRQGDPRAGLQAAELQGERRALAQPRDSGRVSHRLDVQADHRDRGARGRADHPRDRVRWTEGRSESAA